MKSGLALVVGNINYTTPGMKLVNAVNDAKAVSRKLLRLGFVVQTCTDCTMDEFSRALEEFGEQLDKHKVGLFYYAGHGLQIKGENFLTGTDTNFFDSHSVRYSSINVDEIISRMQIESLQVKILVLDACRDNRLPEIRGASNKGLAPIYAPKGTIIAFSTSPGETAKDLGPGKNSVYTGAFLQHIDDVNIPIEEFFKRVRTSVFAHSKGEQTSWEHTSLIGDFYFNSGQLIHSVDLPYKTDYIADGLFESSGSDFDEMILAMRSHNWYNQGPAFTDFRLLKLGDLNESKLFLVGRNILQMAAGGERAIRRIMNNGLDNFLSDYFTGEENHLLNGILFEIYFNSKGIFREQEFKNAFITEIFALQKNSKYRSSFDFISRQLRPFKDYIFYMPNNNPKTLPIEVLVEKYEGQYYDKRRLMWEVVSVKHNNVELLHLRHAHPFSSDKKTFMTKLASALTVPQEQLRVTWNREIKDETPVLYPFSLTLSRFPLDDD